MGCVAIYGCNGTEGDQLQVAAQDLAPLCDYARTDKPRVVRNDRTAQGEDLLLTKIITDPANAEAAAADFMAARREATRLGFTSQAVGPDEITVLGQLLDDAKPVPKR